MNLREAAVGKMNQVEGSLRGQMESQVEVYKRKMEASEAQQAMLQTRNEALENELQDRKRYDQEQMERTQNLVSEYGSKIAKLEWELKNAKGGSKQVIQGSNLADECRRYGFEPMSSNYGVLSTAASPAPSLYPPHLRSESFVLPPVTPVFRTQNPGHISHRSEVSDAPQGADKFSQMLGQAPPPPPGHILRTGPRREPDPAPFLPLSSLPIHGEDVVATQSKTLYVESNGKEAIRETPAASHVTMPHAASPMTEQVQSKQEALDQLQTALAQAEAVGREYSARMRAPATQY